MYRFPVRSFVFLLVSALGIVQGSAGPSVRDCRMDHFRASLGRVCTVYIKREIPIDGKDDSYNSFAELEYYLKHWLSDNEPEISDFTQLPSSFSQRQNPVYPQAGQSKNPPPVDIQREVTVRRAPSYDQEPLSSWSHPQASLPGIPPTFQEGQMPVSFRDPHLYDGTGYKALSQSNSLPPQDNRRFVPPMSPPMSPSYGAMMEQGLPPRPPPRRWKRGADWQNLIVKCCQTKCTPLDFIEFATNHRICG